MATLETGRSGYKMYLEADAFVKRFAEELVSNELEDNGMTDSEDILEDYREQLKTKEDDWKESVLDHVWCELECALLDFKDKHLFE